MNCILCYVVCMEHTKMDQIDAYTNNQSRFVKNTYTVGEEYQNCT